VDIINLLTRMWDNTVKLSAQKTKQNTQTLTLPLWGNIFFTRRK